MWSIISGNLGVVKAFVGFSVLANEAGDVFADPLVGLGATVFEGDGEGVVSPVAEETLFVEVGNFHGVHYIRFRVECQGEAGEFLLSPRGGSCGAQGACSSEGGRPTCCSTGI